MKWHNLYGKLLSYRRTIPYIGIAESWHTQERRNVSRTIRVNNVERFAGNPHESFIEGLTS